MNTHHLIGFAICCFATLAASEGAQAKDSPGEPSRGTQVTLTPRFSYYFDDFSSSGFYFLPSPGNGSVNESVESPKGPLTAAMYGMNVSVRPSSMPRATFTLGFLYGRHKGIDIDGLIVDSRAQSTQTGPFFGREMTKLNYQRLDVEGTFQYRLNDFVALIGGVRYERGRINYRACFENYDGAASNLSYQLNFGQAEQVCRALISSGVVGDSSTFGASLDQLSTTLGAPLLPEITTNRDKPTNIFFRTGPKGKDGYDVLTARFGAAINVPLTESRRQNIYAQGLMVVGHRSVAGPDQRRFDRAVVMGPDISFGYSQALGSHLSLDVRYRASYLFPLSGPRDIGSPRVSHGVVLSTSYRL